MKKLITLFLAVILTLSIVGCGGNQTSNSTSQSTSEITSETQSSNSTEVSISQSTTSSSVAQSSGVEIKPVEPAKQITRPTTIVTPTVNAKPKIFLAGDSTVKTYPDAQYIGGWGQYLQNFLNAEIVTVDNKSNGGRSSRSFINEGRLFTNPDKTYTDYVSIESEISVGDYLLIQFGHNDDMTRNNFDTYIERQVVMGEPDKDGIYPTIVPTEMKHKNYIPEPYLKEYEKNQSKINSAYTVNSKYGDYHYAADQGTFKGYLKMYVDFARSKGAIPILCTPVARVKFDSNFDLLAGNGRHGPNFEYVVAVRQLATELDCLLIDTFDFSKQCLETCAKNANNIEEANYLMALKPNGLNGAWPNGYDTSYNNKDAGYTGIEGTHYNKYGAYLQAGYVAECLLNFANESKTTSYSESVTFGSNILTTPTKKIVPSTLMQATTVTKLTALLKLITVA